MMFDLGEYQEESVNIIAIIHSRREPQRRADHRNGNSKNRGAQGVLPDHLAQNSADLLQFTSLTPAHLRG